MKNREEAKFAEWKKARLMEGFLDGEEEKPVSSEDSVNTEETNDEQTSEELPAEEEKPVENDENTDISEENPEEEKTDDGLEDDFEGEKDESGTKETDPEVAELKDAIATLTQQIQALTDQMVKANEGETKEEPVEEPVEDETSSEESSEETSTEESGEENKEETSNEESTEEEETPKDETKSEAYNFYRKKGNILSENSGYMISILDSGRFDKLESNIMAVVNAKIRQRIEKEKTRLKTEAFNKKFGS